MYIKSYEVFNWDLVSLWDIGRYQETFEPGRPVMESISESYEVDTRAFPYYQILQSFWW